jgi:hypothetical protein
MKVRSYDALLAEPQALIGLVAEKLYASSAPAPAESGDLASSAAVLLLLCQHRPGPQAPEQLCLVLNKRSAAVRQPGDLCLPGGGISSALDTALSWLLSMPGSPLRTWPCYEWWRADGRNRLVPLLLTAALREGFEEMKLDPFSPQLLGLLPPQGLQVMRGAIHPVVAWLRHPQSFRPNWEVERVVLLPLRDLLDPSRHGRLRVRYASGEPPLQERLREEFGCLEIEGELLWGLTYRIVEQLLLQVLDFKLPPMKSRFVRELTLADDYFTRRRAPA